MADPRLPSLRRCSLALVALLAGCAMGSGGGHAKVALVIGNSAYEGVPALNNPVNDASDMCAALKRLGYTTLCYTNVRDRAEFDAHVTEYSNLLTPGTAAVFFYSGHGVQANNASFLIPTQAEPKNIAADPLKVLYGVDELFEHLRSKPVRFQLVVLDACRTELFAAASTPRMVGGAPPKPAPGPNLLRSLAAVPRIGNGLAPIHDAPAHTMVLYATASKEAAYDGKGRNGPLTKHVLANIEKRDLPVRDFLQRVTVGVQAETGAYKQPMTPFVYASFGIEFCFAGCPSTYPPAPIQ
jgi:uncharacterized caspase-like protein